jgi:alanyl-tRNA synthetase
MEMVYTQNSEKEKGRMTEHSRRLFYEDPYGLEFEAKVVERRIHEGKPALVLDRTCFYPEGGGQPADRGTLGDAAVVDVQDEEGRILHILEGELEGDTVRGRVDGFRRLSQAFFHLLEGETRSFHLGEDVSTLEIGLSGMSQGQVTRVEERANAVVFENREVKTYFKDDRTIAEVPLRRPPKVTGRIRVVEVADFDYSACGGTHCLRTGEVGIIKITRWEKIRENLRFDFLCGWRALRDYGMKHRQIRELSTEMTVGEAEVAAAFVRMQADLKSLRREHRKAREQLVEQEARDLLQNRTEDLLIQTFRDRDPNEVRQLAAAVVNNAERAVVFGLTSADRVHIYLGCAKSLGINMQDLVKVVSPLIEGRGGGPPTLVQIGGTRAEGLEKALSAAASYIRSRLDLTL